MSGKAGNGLASWWVRTTERRVCRDGRRQSIYIAHGTSETACGGLRTSYRERSKVHFLPRGTILFRHGISDGQVSFDPHLKSVIKKVVRSLQKLGCSVLSSHVTEEFGTRVNERALVFSRLPMGQRLRCLFGTLASGPKRPAIPKRRNVCGDRTGHRRAEASSDGY